MKIVIDSAIPYIKDRFSKETEVIYLPGKEISAGIIKDADALIVRTRTICNENLLKDSSIKLVATATIGTDHIDISWCEANNIIVCSAPGCNAPGVAQYVFSSLFKAGFNPKTDTLGIIGYGNVGATVADWARKMNIKCLISDNPRKEAGYKDIDYVDIKTVLKNCDALTLHVPFTKEGNYPTNELIAERELSMMKPGSILVNSSRGGVVEEYALKSFLSQGKLKAIVDVWENEPEIDSELVDLSFISTPHIAGYSTEGKMRATRMVLEAVKEVLGEEVNTSGLECNCPENVMISRELIEDSYNPEIDSRLLKKNILKFEQIRNEYTYRHEPQFNTKD